jgi:hypothetical protein
MGLITGFGKKRPRHPLAASLGEGLRYAYDFRRRCRRYRLRCFGRLLSSRAKVCRRILSAATLESALQITGCHGVRF